MFDKRSGRHLHSVLGEKTGKDTPSRLIHGQEGFTGPNGSEMNFEESNRCYVGQEGRGSGLSLEVSG